MVYVETGVSGQTRRKVIEREEIELSHSLIDLVCAKESSRFPYLRLKQLGK